MTFNRTVVMEYLKITFFAAALWVSIGIFAFAQDLVLKMDQECEKLASYQILGSSVFWKIELKKDCTITVSLHELGKPEVVELGEFTFCMNNLPKYLIFTSYEEGDKKMLQFTVQTKSGSGSKVVSVDRDVILQDGWVPKLIRISDSSDGHVMLYQPDDWPVISVSQKSQIDNLGQKMVPPINANVIPKKYELIIQRYHLENHPNTEIRSSSTGSR